MARSKISAWLLSAPLLILLLWVGFLPRSVRSGINGLELDVKKAPVRYSFVLAGHAYGSHTGPVHPAMTLQRNIGVCNDESVRFVVLLGDMLQRVTPGDIRAFERGFSQRVRVPIFNALGNHDNGDRGAYQYRFGDDTYYSFRYGSELFVFLDSEVDDGRIAGDQLRFLLEKIRGARRGVRNIFIFSHRLLWAIDNPALEGLTNFVNGPDLHRPGSSNFYRDIVPALKKLDQKVYLVAGDVGTKWSFPVFYQEAEGLTYMATGLGDNEADRVIVATVDGGKVGFRSVPLTANDFLSPQTRTPLALEHFGMDFWRKLFAGTEHSLR